ncbi:GntR family transcriptional regulator [Pelagovum pacificum]|nr:GntR family transcriptional regulator [Pelagovum pacificum]
MDTKSPVPVYLQVEQDIRRQILTATLAPDMRLPRETELARLYGISRMTVRNALERLEDASLIRRDHGVGTVITVPQAEVDCDLSLMMPLQTQLTEQGFTPSVQFFQNEVIEPAPRIAAALEVAPGTEVLFLNRLVKIDGRPMALIRSWVPLAMFPGLESRTLIDGSLWKTLEAHYDCTMLHSSKHLELISVSTADALILHLADGERTLAVTGLGRDGKGAAVEYSYAIWMPTARLNFDSHFQALAESN